MQRHERHDPEPDKPDPKDTRAKWLPLAIAVLLGHDRRADAEPARSFSRA